MERATLCREVVINIHIVVVVVTVIIIINVLFLITTTAATSHQHVRPDQMFVTHSAVATTNWGRSCRCYYCGDQILFASSVVVEQHSLTTTNHLLPQHKQHMCAHHIRIMYHMHPAYAYT